MKITVHMVARDNSYVAVGIYEGERFIVCAGSKIRQSFAEHIRGGKLSKKYRGDNSFVDVNGYVTKDCVFKSPSTAAQFVAGCSLNGYESWKNGKKNLRKIIEAQNNEN